MWGFLCPICLHLQFCSYSDDLHYSSSSNPITKSQLERYPPFSCHGICDSEDFNIFLCCYCSCFYGCISGMERHDEALSNFEHCCSSQSCCFTCHSRFGRTIELAVEDCLIGYFCCCCSIIQIVMVNEELFRMQSKVEGGLNIKRAH